MRVEFDPADFDIDLADFAKHFASLAEQFEMKWRLAEFELSYKEMVILVSKYDHCLVDLLYRQHSGELACEIPLIISNHADNQSIADFYRIPYTIVSVTKDNKQEAESRTASINAVLSANGVLKQLRWVQPNDSSGANHEHFLPLDCVDSVYGQPDCSW